MKIAAMILCLLMLSVPGLSAETENAGSRAEEFPADYQEAKPGPPPGNEIRKYADDAQEGAQENFGVQVVHDNGIFAVFRGDRFEYQSKDGEDTLLWDVQGWIGADFNKLYLESEGTWLTDREEFEEAELELLYGRNIASYWDFQIGVRHDFKPDPDRTFAAVGFQGLAPYWFEIDATAYVSEDGDISAALEAEYELLLSQRLILMPRLETGAAFQEVEEYGVGQGFTDITLGIRMRYEIRREFAPYIGVSWSRLLGETEDLAEAEGEDTDVTSYVAGVRFWF